MCEIGLDERESGVDKREVISEGKEWIKSQKSYTPQAKQFLFSAFSSPTHERKAFNAIINLLSACLP